MTRQPKIERKTEYFPVVGEVKATNDSLGITEGYLNFKGNVDHGLDRTMDGAFRKSLSDSYSRKGTQDLDYLWPYLWNHDYSILPPGGIFDADEDKKGLYIKTQYNLDSQLGRELYAAFKNGFMRKQSMGYKAYQYEYAKESGQTVRNLLEVGVMEGSAVVFPMNDLSDVTTVKAFARQVKHAPDASPDFASMLQHMQIHDWIEDFDMPYETLKQAIIQILIQSGNDSRDAIQSVLQQFNSVMLDYIQRGLDLGIDFSQDVHIPGNDMPSVEDPGYMSRALALETKQGRMLSGANHGALDKACKGIMGHVGDIQKVLKAAQQQGDAGKSSLPSLYRGEGFPQTHYLEEAFDAELSAHLDSLLSNILNSKRK